PVPRQLPHRAPGAARRRIRRRRPRRTRMTDYGHDLMFGTFITPRAAGAQQVLRLAELADTEGLDLVTFQDHPYQPAFLDTWTLMTYVAARTSRVRIAPNVTNLPLRPPAVLARAAASLDILSGGRFELGIGAGGFWDAIEAMGGRRDRKSTRLNSSHVKISYAVFC